MILIVFVLGNVCLCQYVHFELFTIETHKICMSDIRSLYFLNNTIEMITKNGLRVIEYYVFIIVRITYILNDNSDYCYK